MDKQQQYQLECDNYFLNMKLEIVGAIASGNMDSILRRIAEEHVRAKYEREMYATKISQFIDQLVYVSDEVKRALRTSEIRRNSALSEMKQILGSGKLTYMSSVWLRIFDAIESPTYEEYKTLETLPASKHEDILINALPELYKIAGRAKLNAFWDLSATIFALVAGYSDDPQAICYEIVRELRTTDEAKIETVSRLSTDWIYNTFPRSLTVEKLHQAINLAYQFRIQKNSRDRAPLSQGDYALKHYETVKSDSNLRHFIEYLENIEREATHVSDLIRDSIDAILGK